MNDLTRDSDRILAESKALVRDNREGGRHRRAPSIGAGSAKVKREHLMKKVRNVAIALFALWVGMGVLGIIVDGIGFVGIMALVVASVVAIGVLGNYPKMRTPRRADINKGNVQQMVSRTELWLEAQRPALPAPAARIVGDMGVQLDALGLQLEGLDQDHPKAREVRSLVGEQLPEMIDSYRRIPAHLRKEERAGSTPDQQLTDSLDKISGEIDSITRQLAEGSLDDLAIKHRYLDYKFGSGAETSPQLEHKS
ncbi:conjugal transfer protein TraF [Qipengyuania sp. YG27]|uniref:Conjugal transfer protein TraF n=1 Tax=Qipengyuania mesophila TaxID=2867246 RepID=A0ABS7JSR8_9SPHN|nr:conjugal transfer protein TraF [Qipengyuania mesophila]MBX7500693.1 conjugal transfer protein TraF [Qipengyuania mesophila]